MTLSPVTALIAEDEPLLAQGLADELALLWPALRIVARVGDGASALAEALAWQPTLCFLDIRMPGMTGLACAQALAEDWPAGAAPFPLLVFVTAHEDHAVQAFEAQAVDYLVKPVDRPRLAASVARLQQRLAERAHATAMPSSADAAWPQALAQLRALLASAAPAPQPRLEVIQASQGATVHLVPVDEVLYFEAADKYLRVVTADGEYLIRLSLRELLPQLDGQRFWQVHRGTVVQARAVRTAVRDDSGRVTLSVRGRQEKLVASRLYAHLFKGM